MLRPYSVLDEVVNSPWLILSIPFIYWLKYQPNCLKTQRILAKDHLEMAVTTIFPYQKCYGLLKFMHEENFHYENSVSYNSKGSPLGILGQTQIKHGTYRNIARRIKERIQLQAFTSPLAESPLKTRQVQC